MDWDEAMARSRRMGNWVGAISAAASRLKTSPRQGTLVGAYGSQWVRSNRLLKSRSGDCESLLTTALLAISVGAMATAKGMQSFQAGSATMVSMGVGLSTPTIVVLARNARSRGWTKS